MIRFYLGSISVFCPCCCWCGKLLQNLSPLLTRNLPISRMSVTHGYFIVICSPANIVLHWNSCYPPWCLSQDVLIDCNHILSQHSIISSLSILSVELTKPGFLSFFTKSIQTLCSLVLLMAALLCFSSPCTCMTTRACGIPEQSLSVPSAVCACFCLC